MRSQYLLEFAFDDLYKVLCLHAFHGNRDLPAGRAPGLTDVIRGEFLPTLLATTDEPYKLDIVRAAMDFGGLKGIEPDSHHRSRGLG